MSEAIPDLPEFADYDVILVNSSAGKDSQAMLDEVCVRAERAAVLDRVTVLHCALGHVEWPGTAALAGRQAEHYGVRYEERHRERGLLLDQVRQRGRWPSSAARYCTSDQKRGPARKLITQLVAELGPLHRPARVLNCMGLRAEESRARLKSSSNVALAASRSDEVSPRSDAWPVHASTKFYHAPTVLIEVRAEQSSIWCSLRSIGASSASYCSDLRRSLLRRVTIG